MKVAGGSSGMTVIEALTAVVVLSVMALALVQSLTAAQHTRAATERWMQATQLAAEGIEQLRAGRPLAPVRIAGEWTRRGTVTAWNNHRQLAQLTVVVTWNDGAPQEFQLTSLAHR